MVIDTKNIKKYKNGPVTDNIFYSLNPGDRYSVCIRKFTSMGMFAEIDKKSGSLVIEIPHEERNTIKYKDLLKSKEYIESKYVLPIVLGVNVFGDVIIKDLHDTPNLLIGGKTGTGKSVLLRDFYESLSGKLKPADCKVIIIDTKYNDFCNLNNKKNLLCPVIKDINDVFDMFEKIAEMIEYRYNAFHAVNLRNIDQFRNKVSKMPYIVIMIDEMADLMGKNKKKTEDFISAVAFRGRSVGVHLIAATQRTEKDVITKQISADMPNRIAFAVRTKNQSKKILFDDGAEFLLSYGDMLYSEAGRIPLRVHTGI